MLITLLLLVSLSFIYSPTQPSISFPRINCYKSFSKPTLYLPLHINSYTGPEYIKIDFILDVKYTKTFKIEKYWNSSLYFKKVDELCEDYNITFATNGINFYDLLIFVQIFLPKQINPLSYIRYTLEKGFQSDKYMLIDQYGNFGISVKITDSKKIFPQKVVGDIKEAYMYLRTLKYEGNHICFVTDNNRYNYIKPFFDDENKEKSYIIGIMAKVITFKTYPYYTYYEFPAFECDVPEGYNKPAYFIFEGDHEPIFVANTTKITEENKLITQAEIFSIDKTNNKLTKKMLYSKNFNLVFLIKQTYIYCEDFTNRKVYKSKNNTVLYAHRLFELQVKPTVKRHQWVIYDPFNPCK